VPIDERACADGVRVIRCQLVLGEQPRLAGVKSLNRLENVLARAEWRDSEVREGLLADAAGRVIEATMSNVFAVFGRRLVTPDLSRCGVRGAQRERVLELAHAAGVPVEVADISFAGLLDADEVFLANSIIGVWPVSACGERAWKPGPVTREVQALLARDDG
jgi:4-amino-4-deoxychorismate lyase